MLWVLIRSRVVKEEYFWNNFSDVSIKTYIVDTHQGASNEYPQLLFIMEN